MKKALPLIAFFFLLKTFSAFSQGPQLSVTSSNIVCASNGCQPIAQSVAISGASSTTIDGLNIYFYSGYNPNQDSLSFTPMFGVTGAWDSSTGVLTLAGVATAAQYELIIKSVVYCSKVQPATSGLKNLYIVLGALLYNPVNNHYYKKVSLPQFNYISWHDASTASSASNYLGMQGYLINITTVQENNFISQLVNSNTWIGASDELVENEWRWVSGCEGLENGGTGRYFSNQQSFNCGQSGFLSGSSVGGNYVNWALGEPNGCNNGAESYAHLFSNGQWNDYEDSGYVSAYIIEYGCMPNDPIVQTYDNINLYVNDSIATPNISNNLPICDGGTVNLSASGVYSSNVTYAWSGPSGFSSNTNIASVSSISSVKNGVYTVVVNDSGCVSSKTYTLIQPPPVSSNFISKTDALCFNSSSGIINQIGIDGHPNYSYLWNNGQTSASLLNIPAGTYTVTITDAIGCTGTANYSIGQPSLLSSNIITTVDVSCQGNDGSAVATATGGTSPYSYLWNSGCSISNCSGMTVGPFTVTITDGNGCSSISNGNLNSIAPLSLTTINNPLICIGQPTTLSILASGGTAPYQYLWSNGNTNGSTIVSPTTNQSFSVTVTDANNCTKDYTYNVSVNPPISNIISNNSSICNGLPVNLSVTGQGGNGNLSYLWSNGVNSNTQTISPNSTTLFYVTISDNCGTPPKTDSVLVTVFDNPIVNISFDNNHGCVPFDINFSNNAVPISGASYLWSFSNGITSTAQAPTITFLDSGKFSVGLIITSIEGCTTQDSVDSAINSYLTPDIDFDFTPKKGCMPLEVSFLDKSNTSSGSNYDWDLGNGEFSNDTNPSTIYPDSGLFTIILSITNPQGCKATDTIVDAIESYSTPIADFSFSPQTPTILFNKVDFEDKSSGSVNQWLWTFGDSLSNEVIQNPTHYFNNAGDYEVTLIVSNQYECSDTIVKTIPVVNDYSFYIPKAFTPNDDGVNDILEMYGFNFSNFDFKIYNRHGQLVNEAVKNPLWDGRDLDGNFLPAGVYVYTIKLRETLNNKRHEYQGTVTLIR